MLQRLFATLFRNRPAASGPHRPRCRLAVEQLEDRRLLSATPAAVGTLSQALTNPTTDLHGNVLQYITAGSYQTVVSQTVTVTSSQTGLFQLNFQAQAYSGQSTRVGVRYLIDSQFDPNDAVIRAGTGADCIADIGTAGYQMLDLSRLLTLSPGTHTIIVQVYTTMLAATPSTTLTIYSPQFSIVGFNTIDSQSAAVALQTQTPASPVAGASATQHITSGSWQTVASQSFSVSSNKTGMFSLAFEAQAFAQLGARVSVRYLIDGNPDPHDAAVSSNGPGADLVEDLTDGFGGGDWETLWLNRQLVLTGGTHTVTVQVTETTLTTSDLGVTLYAPTLGIIGYNIVDAQHSADGLQTQTVTSPDPVNAGQQDITAGSWQTVASLSVPVAGIRSGLYTLNFEAPALASGSNRVFVRYLIDGNVDPNDAAVASSASGADATIDFFNGHGAGTWHALTLNSLLALPSGTHTITVQVFCTTGSPGDAPDLVVSTPQLSVVGYNNITPGGSTGGTGGGTGGGTIPPPSTTTFAYNPSTQVLVVNGTSHVDTIRISQSTKLVTPAGGGTPALVTTYTFSVNGSSVSYTSNQLSQVYVYGNGGNDTASLYTNDTYTGADGNTHATVENLSLGAGGGILQQINGSGIATNFLQLLHVPNIYGYMGNEDTAQLHDSPGNDMFVSAGLTSYLTGVGYYDYVSGATSVTAYATTGHDTAYQYDGSGASIFTATGVTSSVMTGTDGAAGVTFTDTAQGFHFNYGIARHSGDTANLYDGPGTNVFVGQAKLSYMYSYAGSVQTMYNQAAGFSSVNAFATAGSIDYSFNYAPTVNSVTGFKHIVG
jgi:hypothetical protein